MFDVLGLGISDNLVHKICHVGIEIPNTYSSGIGTICGINNFEGEIFDVNSSHKRKPRKLSCPVCIKLSKVMSVLNG